MRIFIELLAPFIYIGKYNVSVLHVHLHVHDLQQITIL